MIHGVRVRRLESHSDPRGSLTEVLRSDWPEFAGFGQAMVTVNQPGVIRGWHWHERQADAIVVLRGTVLLPLYDGREGSATRGSLTELVARPGEPWFALFVPPGVWHGYRTLGSEPALILNFPDRPYHADAPDEHRAPHDAPKPGYSWEPSS